MWNFIKSLLGLPIFPEDWTYKEYYVYNTLRSAGFNVEDAIDRASHDKEARKKMDLYYEMMFPRSK
jgi:hypothetical protein